MKVTITKLYDIDIEDIAKQVKEHRCMTAKEAVDAYLTASDDTLFYNITDADKESILIAVESRLNEYKYLHNVALNSLYHEPNWRL